MLFWESRGAMGFHSMLVLVTWVGVMLTAIMAAAAIAYPLALPNCPDRCGDVKIPYPFGTREGCYRKESRNFIINCSNSSGQPQPMTGDLPITSISIEGEMGVMMDSSTDCYNQSGTALSNDTEQGLLLSSFTVSVTNMFVAVGCDTFAFLSGILKDEPFTTGCLSKCNNTGNIVNGNCSGIGCCHVDIPEGLTHVDFAAYSFKNHSDVWSFNPCSFAFIIQKDEFSFSSDYLTSLRNNESFPMVLDWAIGNETCEVARNKGNYICGANSNCSDLNNGSAPGYRCKCKEGYVGNPYLKDGCQDIDECNDKLKCPGKQICVNEVGSYHCSCIKGYHKVEEVCVPRRSSLTIYLAVGISIISLLVLLLGCSWIYYGLKKRKIIKLKEKFFHQNGGLLLKQQLSNHQKSMETTKIFTTEELKKATNNYDKSRVLGQGGYGTVYRGVLSDNTIVAIKKSKIGDQSQIEQFINEMIVLTQINHRNVVKLFGCCLETEVPLLVYEFITYGTLSNHVHDKSLSSLLSWEKRLKIATEIAGALAYLHSSASMSIIHRDVKTANILLDDDYTAKVADFGASRLVPLDQTQLTTLVQGTLGYLDPEYMQTSQLTEKSDVYSFGVVMAELLTGKKALSFARPEIDRNLAISFVSAIKEDRLLQILEDHIVSEGNIEQLKEIANLAKQCLSLKGEDRPFMKEVAKELERLRSMEKTPLGNIDVDGKKTEYLLSATSHSFNIDVGTGCSTSTIAEYDSIREQELKSVEDGR
ncbi:wall-associated receptor kinase 2-like [Castanea sativa]|uniref:wall-associated receptor kinase 2-like n=1 Tax=Castanea sativa TaxID=21020 RepID=UPI003F651F7E